MSNDKPQIGFNFDTYKAEGAGEDFVFVLDGKPRKAKNAATLPGVEFFEAALKGDANVAIDVLRKALKPQDLADLRASVKGSLPALNAFMKAYLAHGGIGEGNPS